MIATDELSSTPGRTDIEATGNEGLSPTYISGHSLGWAFLVCAGVLVIAIAYFVFIVLESMTQPTKILDSLVAHFVEQAKTEGQARVETAVHLAMVLEYANADLRATGVQIAFSLIAGMLFAVVGVLLFAAGATGALEVAGEGYGRKFKLNTVAPGLVSILLGGVIIGFGVHKDLSRPLQADVLTAIRMDVQPQKIKTPLPKGESVAEDEALPH